MLLEFTFSEGYTVGVPVQEDVWEAGDFNPIREAVGRIPTLFLQFRLVAFTFLEYGVLDFTFSANGVPMPKGCPSVSLRFWEDSIHARLTLGDGTELDSSNWYGYDGEPGNDGADNDEDNEDSDGGE